MLRFLWTKGHPAFPQCSNFVSQSAIPRQSLLNCSIRYLATAAASSSQFDVVVVGGGPGGYVTAIKAAQLGLSTACVEHRGTLGGTCLNVGCIPSKAILNISHKYKVKNSNLLRPAERNGVRFSKLFCFCLGIEMLFKKNKVQYIKGKGKLLSGTSLAVELSDGSGQQEISAKNIIIATGSEPSPMPGNIIAIDEKVVVTSTGVLVLPSIPERMVVVGGGVIGLELGSVWNRLGSKVEVVEFLDRICPSLDGETALAFKKSLEKQGLKFHLSTKVVGADVRSEGATVFIESSDGNKKASIETDIVLVAVGRRPYTENLGLEALGIELDKAKRIIVDDEFRIPKYHTVRAIGDVIAGPMLAHKAEEEGVAVAELIANTGSGHVNYASIPSVVYTHPEVAGVGATEEELKAKGIKYGKGAFPFAANSRARANDDAEVFPLSMPSTPFFPSHSLQGMVKILTNKETDRLLGAWILGPNAGELIQELVLAMEYGASSEDIGRTCHAHPTLSEAVKEACLAAYSKPIHMA
ncbi:pyruvate dehydrogenase complex subunit PDH-E3II [Cardiosporidium cionae]|uniref:Pyruvate dehydrogenase complex subunit PDH-E3II n=1 Tax=Cardiosporidium cionae TaxID=476202 RepID=A0ABQ7J9V1_9APIC|nr:pyruvate dehydrogenase complex subunit PDH-E3II [Cardiosporidium cionae]|eukprot:KAF8820709.1 pyruvate dehydrogenase complex subunit PDH-E3II [Cardiosporidium cionae]